MRLFSRRGSSARVGVAAKGTPWLLMGKKWNRDYKNCQRLVLKMPAQALGNYLPFPGPPIKKGAIFRLCVRSSFALRNVNHAADH